MCPKCFIEMKIGIAIEPKEERQYFTIAPEPKLKHPLNIEQVYKCTNCGRSELLPERKDILY
jgi:hypothetical protein